MFLRSCNSTLELSADVIGNRTVRVLAIPFLVGAVASILLPRATGFAANYAVVNAPVLSVTAPFEGSIQQASGALASPVVPGDVLLDLRATRASEAEIARLEARKQTLTAQLAAIDAEILRASLLEAELVERLKVEKRHALDRIRARISVLSADRDAAATRVEHLQRQLERAEFLSKQRALPEAQLEKLRYELQEAYHHQARAAAMLAAENVALGIVNAANALDASDLASYTRQRLDELAIKHSDLKTRRAFNAADLAAVTPLLQATKDEHRRFQNFRPIAPASGVVWKASRSARTAVSVGQEIMQVLDCSRRYIEVSVNERFFDRIANGSVATVRLRGSSETFSASVVSLRGSAVRVAEAELPAISRSEVLSEFTLYIDIDAADPSDPGMATAFCDVGRSAEVWFKRPTGVALDQFVGRVHSWINDSLGLATTADFQPDSKSP